MKNLSCCKDAEVITNFANGKEFFVCKGCGNEVIHKEPEIFNWRGAQDGIELTDLQAQLEEVTRAMSEGLANSMYNIGLANKPKKDAQDLQNSTDNFDLDSIEQLDLFDDPFWLDEDGEETE
jgi:hypothetical protein